VKALWILPGIALLILSACQSLSEQRQATLLQDTLRRYEATVRWGALSQAHEFVDPGARVELENPRPDLRITGYEVLQGPAMVDAQRAVQAVLIEYVFESTQQLRQVVDQQVWRYDPQTETWSRQSPLPEFK